MPNDFENTEQNQPQEPASLRATLAASMDAAMPSESAPADDGRPRDEHGRFAPKPADSQPAAQQTAPTAAPTAAPSAAPTQAELTTWRREMRPLQAKLASGQPLTPEEARQLAEYNIQREQEYSTGISTYKSEAQQSKAIQGVMQEFMPALQQAGMAPEAWIQNMGRTHAALVYGSPEQKLQIFANLAQSYGVPLGAVQQAQQGQVDPNITALMGQLQAVQQQVGQVTTWHQQQQHQTMQQQLAKFMDTAQYPHFEQVRGTMAQLLEAGAARDLDDAYAKAIRVDDNAWQAEQQRQAAAADAKAKADRAAVAARARAAGGSVSSSSPAGNGGRPATDLRGALEAAFEEAAPNASRV